MESDDGISRGQVVQLNPDTVENKAFAACFMIVTEPKSWGAQGYIQIPGANREPGSQAYYRAKWEEMEPIMSRAEWIIE